MTNWKGDDEVREAHVFPDIVHGLSDRDCVELLRLLYRYVTEFGDATDMKISEVAADLAMSMDETTDEADQLRKEIESAVS